LKKGGITQEEAEHRRKQFDREWNKAQDRQRVKDIMKTNAISSEDEQATLDIQSTFKQFVSDKKFEAADQHLTFKEYSRLPFSNGMPEIVCDILYYLARFIAPKTGQLSRDTYVRMMEAQ
jgi:hypothetical protein